MSMTLEQVIAVVEELPPALQSEVGDFALFLRHRQSVQATGRLGDPTSPVSARQQPHFKWIGALRELRDEYTSVELQHRVSEWRVESSLNRPV